MKRSDPGPRPSGLPILLLIASDWFNDAITDAVEARGWPRLSRSQSMVFVRIDAEGTRPAELARRLRMTRQSMRELLAKLAEHGLISIEADPDDQRSTIVRLTERAGLLGYDAAMITTRLEAELTNRIGTKAVNDLRRALSSDWGAAPDGSLASDHP